MEFVYNSRNPKAPAAFASFEAMHTIFEMVLVHVGEADARQLAEKAESLVMELGKRLNRHDPESIFYLINASTCNAGIAVDEDTFGILQFCEAFRCSTYGYFDISALSKVACLPAYRLDPASMAVSLNAEGIMLDAGGFGKGYALDHVKRLLTEAGVTDALLNFGDSSVMAIGAHPFGNCWQVGTSSGGRPFRLKDTSLSISGCRPDGKEHIIDPITGKMAADGPMIAVQGRSAFVCEVLSTALYAAPADAREKIIRNFEGYSYTETRQDIGSWIEENL